MGISDAAVPYTDNLSLRLRTASAQDDTNLGTEPIKIPTLVRRSGKITTALTPAPFSG